MYKLAIHIIFLILGSLAILETEAAQIHYGFRQIGSKEGLSASNVKAIAQDSYGFIWIATKNGLDRYDGVSVKTFPCRDEKNQKGNNNIGAIYEDSNHNLWVGTDRGVYILDPATGEFTYFNRESSTGVKIEEWIQTIAGDSQGNIWVLAPNQGVFKIHNNNLDFYSVTNHNGDKEKIPVSMLVSSKGEIYAGTKQQGVYFYDSRNNNFRKLRLRNSRPDNPDELNVQYIDELEDGNLCFATQKGSVYKINVPENTISPIHYSKSGMVFLNSMKCIDDEIWLGSSEGINCVKQNGTGEREISRNTMGTRALSDNTISALFKDRDGNVWAGTLFGGVNLIQRSGFVFERYWEDISQRGLSSNQIRGMAMDNNGVIWIGTQGGGLNILDTSTGMISHVESPGKDSSLTLCVESIGEEIYTGFVRGGCHVYRNGVYKETIGRNLLETVSDVYSVIEDNSGNLWMSASWGLFIRKKGADKFENVEEIGYDWIHDMHQDSNGIIWIASMGQGIWKYEPSTNLYTHYPFDENFSNGLKTNSISSVYEDSKGRVWFSTDRGGLVLYNPKDDNFISYGLENGFPDNTVYGVIEDNSGYLWFGTNRGLVKFNPDTQESVVFTNGFDQFNYHAAVKDRSGRIYLGGIDGIVTFDPSQDMMNDNPNVYFTDLRITGNPDTKNKYRSLLFDGRINLATDENNFSLSLGTPQYNTYSYNEFLYRLLPDNDEWMPVSDPSNLSFAGISPGKYTLEVKKKGFPDNTSAHLSIVIKIPWYQSWWAFCIYGLLIGIVIIILAIYYRRRQLKKLEEKEGIFTIEKEKELYKKKLKFFTEIAHEIRTPLTLIGTPLEAIEEIGVKEPRIKKYLKVIRQNTSRLLDLTNQILDFQKMESDSHPLKIETVDMNSLLQDTVERFEMTITNRNKELVCKLPDCKIFADVDKDAVIKILSNLFNNAMKYSDHYIEISLSVGEDTFEVTVKSDGEKITGENRYKIFEPFYQANKKSDNGGVGIGLALCRTLAHLQGGTIELVDDNDPHTNTFKLRLPLKVDFEEPARQADPVMTEYVMEEDSPMMSDSNGYSLLFVDDNDEMREFLEDQLSKDFVVETAGNGEEALKKLREGRFDIIVTDIMMPVLDGYELCREIKQDPNLSPIPVVFLTAKNDLESKVKALECGGESFIEKPFSIKYFRQQIKSLLDNRRHERKAFLNKPFFSVDNMKVNKADEEFMNKVVDIINKNIDKENFNVESMADILCMSRSSLLRKIKTLFNLSPVELIRIVRLKKAAELIQEGKYRMGDICFMVGINSQSYFTRLFLKQFGISPKTFEKQCREKENPSANAPISPDIDLSI